MHALTQREREVADLIVEGNNVPATAVLLAISEKTVSAHLLNTYAKLGIRDRSELATALRRSNETRAGVTVNLLSQRHQQIVSLIAAGDTDTEIACSLGLTHNTIKRHIQTILRRTGAKNRVQLAVMFTLYRTSEGTTVHA